MNDGKLYSQYKTVHMPWNGLCGTHYVKHDVSHKTRST